MVTLGQVASRQTNELGISYVGQQGYKGQMPIHFYNRLPIIVPGYLGCQQKMEPKCAQPPTLTFTGTPLIPEEPPKKPRRPLSAYNLFFRHERSRLLYGSSGSGYGNGGILRDETTLRPLGFTGLVRHVSSKWNNLDWKTRSVFDGAAGDEKRRYRAEMKEYRSAMGKWTEQNKMSEDRDGVEAEEEAEVPSPDDTPLDANVSLLPSLMRSSITAHKMQNKDITCVVEHQEKQCKEYDQIQIISNDAIKGERRSDAQDGCKVGYAGSVIGDDGTELSQVISDDSGIAIIENVTQTLSACNQLVVSPVRAHNEEQDTSLWTYVQQQGHSDNQGRDESRNPSPQLYHEIQPQDASQSFVGLESELADVLGDDMIYYLSNLDGDEVASTV